MATTFYDPPSREEEGKQSDNYDIIMIYIFGDICGADFAGSNDSMEMYPAILMHILV